MAAKSGEFVAVPVAAHPHDSASEPEPVTDGLIPGKDRAAAGARVLERDHRAPFADRDARPRLTVADTDGADVFARERGVSSREALLSKNGPAGLAVSDLFFKRETGAPLVDMARAGGLTVGGTNANDVFALERGVSESDLLPRETGEPLLLLLLLLDKHRDVFARERGMSFGDALLGNNHPAGLREIDTPLLDEKFFSDDYSFARKTAAPPFAGLVAADEHGARTDKALRPAPSAPHSEQVAIDVLVGAKEVPVAAGADSGGGHGGNLSTVVGIFAASTAVTMVAAGPVSPPVAFGAFLLLLGFGSFTDEFGPNS
ncbi:uncharacterized protein [Oryza sativa Japonica Group]|uniref:uncharacterized protein isoform X2 n=1 Tax=Oryza sativa subsp. japonica TaxID=39947 RepID=UPI000E1BBF01|nr:uncharacterized protein LOC107278382 isoform X2 [Oryza sativa Japonica Group]KAF2918399.1 hypothetical protein DAI22_08g055100 [Oryza sativa Japonica Group]